MSIPVSPTEVASRVEEYGPIAVLVSATATGQPHVSSVSVSIDDGVLTAPVGSTTVRNVASNPAVTLLWQADDKDYLLLLDGTGDALAQDDGGAATLRITVAKGVLHRKAGRADAGPSCVALGETPSAQADSACG